MKYSLLLMLMLFTNTVLAETRIISTRDKVRLHLWFNGIKSEQLKKKHKLRVSFPEELERPLHNFP